MLDKETINHIRAVLAEEYDENILEKLGDEGVSEFGKFLAVVAEEYARTMAKKRLLDSLDKAGHDEAN